MLERDMMRNAAEEITGAAAKCAMVTTYARPRSFEVSCGASKRFVRRPKWKKLSIQKMERRRHILLPPLKRNKRGAIVLPRIMPVKANLCYKAGSRHMEEMSAKEMQAETAEIGRLVLHKATMHRFLPLR